MTRHGPMLLALLVLAIASWTYNVNYDTRAALERVSKMRAEIADERENLQVLRVEWAYLNAPDRLARLVGAHNEELALVTLTPDALGQVASVPYPRRAPAIPSLPDEFLVADAGDEPSDMDGENGDSSEAADMEAGNAESDDMPDDMMAEAAPSESDDVIGELIASMADEAPEITENAPATMEEAVQLALAEAGIDSQAKPRSSEAQLVSVSTAGTPMPPARPAVLAHQ